jgi:secreted trypsin-like serine protease
LQTYVKLQFCGGKLVGTRSYRLPAFARLPSSTPAAPSIQYPPDPPNRHHEVQQHNHRIRRTSSDCIIVTGKRLSEADRTTIQTLHLRRSKLLITHNPNIRANETQQQKCVADGYFENCTTSNLVCLCNLEQSEVTSYVNTVTPCLHESLYLPGEAGCSEGAVVRKLPHTQYAV